MSNFDIDYSRYEALKIDLDDRGILTITLSNPGKKNALTPAMNEELCHIFDDAWKDKNVSVIILTGEGDAFCSGADVSGMASKGEPDPNERRNPPPSRHALRHAYGMLDCEKPIISKIRGVAYGAGVMIALYADITFAAEGTRLCDSHAKVGLVPGDGAALWPLLMGFNRAKEYLMLGKPIRAEQAAEIGLINYCVPDDELDARVQEMADELLAMPPLAVTCTKSAVNMMLKQMMAAAMGTGLAHEWYTMRTDDNKEAAKAFMERRPGNYVNG